MTSGPDTDPTEDSLWCRACPVREAAICGRRPADAGAPLAARRLRTRRVGARQVLGVADRPLQEFAVISRGWAARYYVLPDGRRQILSFVLPGEPLVIEGLVSACQPYAIGSLTELELCAFDPEEAHAWVAEHPALACAYLKLHAHHNYRAYHLLTALGRATARQRLASLLLDLYDRLFAHGLATGGDLPFPLRQREIADTLGLTAVHVSRVFREFVVEGVVRRAGPRIELKDLSRLRQIAAEAGLDFHAGPAS